jgi:hypothetical protein
MHIEAGKYYLNRTGECVGPISLAAFEHNPYVWQDPAGRLYLPNGKARTGVLPHDEDLVTEWINPHMPAEQTAGEFVTRHPLKARVSGPVPPPVPNRPAYMERTREPRQACDGGDPSYAALDRVLKMAHEQASRGKGKERHANGQPFDRQPIMELGRMFGPGFAAGQAAKKAQEAMGMIGRGDKKAAVAELLGGINYLAACIMLVQEG